MVCVYMYVCVHAWMYIYVYVWIVVLCFSSLNADILKTAPELLKVVSKHLFGQLQCFVATKHEDIMQKWKVKKKNVMG